jgi:hypothetical protein
MSTDRQEFEIVNTFNQDVIEAYQLLSFPLIAWEADQVVKHKQRVEDLATLIANMRGAVKAAEQLLAKRESA